MATGDKRIISKYGYRDDPFTYGKFKPFMQAKTLKGSTNFSNTCALFSLPDDRILVVGSSEGEYAVYDAALRQLKVAATDKSVTSHVLSSQLLEGTHLVYQYSDDTVYVHNLEDDTSISFKDADATDFCEFIPFTDSSYIYTSTSDGITIRRFAHDGSAQEEVFTLPSEARHIVNIGDRIYAFCRLHIVSKLLSDLSDEQVIDIDMSSYKGIDLSNSIGDSMIGPFETNGFVCFVGDEVIYSFDHSIAHITLEGQVTKYANNVYFRDGDYKISPILSGAPYAYTDTRTCAYDAARGVIYLTVVQSATTLVYPIATGKAYLVPFSEIPQAGHTMEFTVLLGKGSVVHASTQDNTITKVVPSYNHTLPLVTGEGIVSNTSVYTLTSDDDLEIGEGYTLFRTNHSRPIRVKLPYDKYIKVPTFNHCPANRITIEDTNGVFDKFPVTVYTPMDAYRNTGIKDCSDNELVLDIKGSTTTLDYVDGEYVITEVK